MRGPLPLRTVIPAAFLATVLIESILFLIYHEFVIHKQVLNHLHKSAQIELNHFTSNIFQSYQTKDKNVISLEISMLATIPSVRSVIIADETGKISDGYPIDLIHKSVLQTIPQEIRAVIDTAKATNRASYTTVKNSYFAIAPFTTNITAGTLSTRTPSLLILEYDIKEYGRAIHRSGLENSLVFSATMLMIAFFIFFYIRKFVARRAMQIIEETSSFVASNYTNRTTVSGNDELGQIAQAINQLANDVQQNRFDLMKSELRFRSIFESMPLIALELDHNGNIAYANQFLCDLTGWQIEEILGTNWFSRFIPESEQVTIQEVFDFLKSEKYSESMQTIENAILTKNGGRRLIRWSNLLLNENSDEHISIVSIGEDITKKVEEDEEKARLVRLESLSQLSGGIAHDFNNIFAILFGFIDLAGTAIEQKNTNSASEYIANAMDAFQRARALSDQLLTFSKGGSPVKSGTDLVEIIQTCTSFILSGSGISIQYDMPGSVPPALLDRNQISRVFENLAVNARDAMNNSGVITISLSLRNDTFTILFSDNGTGIPEKIAQHVFDPFFSTKSFGHGLGLATVHSIITQHDGTISVQSTPNTGTTFVITLPYYPVTEEISQEEPQSPQAPVTRGSHILILDDEEMILKMMRIALERAGFHVVTATDGLDAIVHYQEQLDNGSRFSCAILDLTLPGGIDGKRVAQEILKIDPSANLYVSSGYSDDPVMASPHEYGFCAALQKPFTVNDLMTLMEPLSKFL